MASVGRKQVSCDRKIIIYPDARFKNARNALCRAEKALATAVLNMAEADCKGDPKPEHRLREIRLAYSDAVRNMEDLRTALPFRSRRGRKK